jgi:ribose transport system substrate-binding protein
MRLLPLPLTALLTICALAAAALTGCGDNSTTTGAAATGAAPAAGAKTLRIGVVPKATSSPYWNIVHAGAVKAANELQSSQPVELLYRGALDETQSDKEIAIVEDMINQQVDAIVLAPNNADALAKYVDLAATKKIPVVIIDSAVNTQKYSAFVATDNKKGGQMGGEELAKRLDHKGKVIMMRYLEGSASTHDREEGALESLKKDAGITIVSADKYGGATDDACQKSAENLLAAYKNADGALSIDGIFCPNLTTTFGMLKAVQNTKSAGKVKFVGFDSSEAVITAMRAGTIDAVVVQDPLNMGYLGVKTAVAIVKGEKYDRTVDTGAHLITKETMDSPETKDILDPPVSKYIK